MNFAVIQFPGSNCDQDCVHVIQNVCGHSARLVWHKDSSLGDADAVLVPGGFSYGDYLRTGSIARFSPVMQALQEFTGNGGLVLGICNGFQILCEAGLLPGALVRNHHLHFVCDFVRVRVEHSRAPFTTRAREGDVLRIPIKHGEGAFFAPPEVLERLERGGQILLRYCDAAGRVSADANPNGAAANIAGITNEKGNVFGLMPHPEHAMEPAIGGTDGRAILGSLVDAVSGAQR